MTIKKPPGMREDQLQEAIIEMCRWHGLYVYHPHNSRRSEEGYPDLTIIGSYGVMFRELKREDGRLTGEQADVLHLLRLSGQDAAVWRPSDLALGNILREIKEFAHPKSGPDSVPVYVWRLLDAIVSGQSQDRSTLDFKGAEVPVPVQRFLEEKL